MIWETGLVKRETVGPDKWIFMYTKHAVFTHGVDTNSAPLYLKIKYKEVNGNHQSTNKHILTGG